MDLKALYRASKCESDTRAPLVTRGRGRGRPYRKVLGDYKGYMI